MSTNEGAQITQFAERPSLHAVLSFFESHVTTEEEKSWLKSWYTSRKLTRKTFFDAAYWAILVANMKVVRAECWAANARECGFPFSWRELRDWNDREFNRWCKRMAKTLVKPKEDLVGKFRARWDGIWDIGKRLAQFESGAEFRKHYFHGKKYGRELTEDDFCRLKEIKRNEGALRQIGDVSIYFILRNLGGNFLKPDTWIEAFAAWYGCESVQQLASMLRSNGIHCGKFDAYCWQYCNGHIDRASDLAGHFEDLFG